MRNKFLFLLFFSFSLIICSAADPHEGLWYPWKIKEIIYNEMRRAGLELSLDQLYSSEQHSIKDAIVQIGNGEGTGTIISEQGLLLISYQTAYPYLTLLSQGEKNYLKEGYFAIRKEEEIPCPHLYVTLLVEAIDITDEVLGAIPEKIPEYKRTELIERKIQRLYEKYRSVYSDSIEIKPVNYGNQYHLTCYKRFTDLRLVGVVNSSVATQGAVLEPHSWPRYNANFALFRIYTDSLGNPNHYDESNIPYEPQYAVPISIQGGGEEAFTMIWGYPKQSKRSISSYEMLYRVKVEGRAKMEAIEPIIPVIKKDIAQMINEPYNQVRFFQNLYNQYFETQQELSNLTALDIIDEVLEREENMKRWVFADDDRYDSYHTLMSDLDTLFKKQNPDLVKTYWYANIILQSSTMLMMPYYIPDCTPGSRTDAEIEEILQQYRARVPFVHKEVEIKLIQAMLSLFDQLPEQYRPKIKPFVAKYYNNNNADYAKAIVESSIFSSEEDLKKYLKRPKTAIYHRDPLIRYYEELTKLIMMSKPHIDSLEHALIPLQRDYAFVQHQSTRGTIDRFYSDANQSLRVSYGNIEGYKPADAVTYHCSTNHVGFLYRLKGELDAKQYPFPEELKTLLYEQDFSSYEYDGELPISFITNADYAHQAPGAAVLDASGNMIGIAIDVNKEALGGDYFYNKRIHRTICIDMRYIMFLIDKYAGASYLFEEMTIIQ
ncbi:MAG TPA: S46 family peptidase [Bacteroidales bacterium]|nr:S46 family peptidase [Bacteroidales bacterium]HOH22837.1 S46 family peptidase [Bacteroidales bacterium]HPB56960.1 S46 family peptidase [Bacteroidales bacterium]HPZ03895.1 S46 family peptidase [Bacteroidales bacterium]HQB75432.1 S46 family peptidase [Bacteroidales bacterium]